MDPLRCMKIIRLHFLVKHAVEPEGTSGPKKKHMEIYQLRGCFLVVCGCFLMKSFSVSDYKPFNSATSTKLSTVGNHTLPVPIFSKTDLKT